jgi:hypothetical protein
VVEGAEGHRSVGSNSAREAYFDPDPTSIEGFAIAVTAMVQLVKTSVLGGTMDLSTQLVAKSHAQINLSIATT